LASKMCSSCYKTLDISNFNKSKKASDGREGQCKECRMEKRRKYHKQCPTCGKEFYANRDTFIYCSRKCSSISQKYTLEDVKHLFEERGCVLLETSYINANTKMKYRCSCSNESEINLGNFLSGVRCFDCGKSKRKGENHPRWNDGLSDDDRNFKRSSPDYIKWRVSVYERDNFRCICCGDARGGNLVAHHLDGHNWCKERRTDVSNGVTLCNKCHLDFHSMYGFGNNNQKQFYEWIYIKRKQDAV
jgi:hypothetical protein